MEKPFINIDIEATNRCNARCITCPRDKIEEFGDMSEETFEIILKRIKEYGKEKIGRVTFSGLGEPLLNKNIFSWTKKLRENGLEVEIVTNGSLVNEENAKNLWKSGLNQLSFSVGSVNKKIYEKLHKNLNFDKFMRNLRIAKELKPKTGKIVIFISPTKESREEMKDIVKKLRNYADYFFFFPFTSNRGGLVKNKKRFIFEDNNKKFENGAVSINEILRPTKRNYKIFSKYKNKCPIMNQIMYIDFKGDAVLCCNDVKKNNVLGNVKNNSLEEIQKEKSLLGYPEVCRKCNCPKELGPKDISSYLALARMALRI